ncbi:unnamed protein product [Darwinula stevensoni]|uniref:Uncharacterized protein n=1 Tax=Darwinula stevensoni TaxID=69355 RepID=A0A7R8ZXT5_9CRUS|nr:unnamed protein product [Darwinula stevensoni]CAG0880070.1 unnamed protein product [Darwinula stevensoni]
MSAVRAVRAVGRFDDQSVTSLTPACDYHEGGHATSASPVETLRLVIRCMLQHLIMGSRSLGAFSTDAPTVDEPRRGARKETGNPQWMLIQMNAASQQEPELDKTDNCSIQTECTIPYSESAPTPIVLGGCSPSPGYQNAAAAHSQPGPRSVRTGSPERGRDPQIEGHGMESCIALSGPRGLARPITRIMRVDEGCSVLRVLCCLSCEKPSPVFEGEKRGAALALLHTKGKIPYGNPLYPILNRWYNLTIAKWPFSKPRRWMRNLGIPIPQSPTVWRRNSIQGAPEESSVRHSALNSSPPGRQPGLADDRVETSQVEDILCEQEKRNEARVPIFVLLSVPLRAMRHRGGVMASPLASLRSGSLHLREPCPSSRSDAVYVEHSVAGALLRFPSTCQFDSELAFPEAGSPGSFSSVRVSDLPFFQQ